MFTSFAPLTQKGSNFDGGEHKFKSGSYICRFLVERTETLIVFEVLSTLLTYNYEGELLVSVILSKYLLQVTN